MIPLLSPAPDGELSRLIRPERGEGFDGGSRRHRCRRPGLIRNGSGNVAGIAIARYRHYQTAQQTDCTANQRGDAAITQLIVTVPVRPPQYRS